MRENSETFVEKTGARDKTWEDFVKDLQVEEWQEESQYGIFEWEDGPEGKPINLCIAWIPDTIAISLRDRKFQPMSKLFWETMKDVFQFKRMMKCGDPRDLDKEMVEFHLKQ